MTHKKCYVCERIPASEVLKTSHKIWSEKDVARKIGLEASKVIHTAYEKNPVFFCGKSRRTLLAGLLYIYSLKKSVRYKYEHNEFAITQREVAEACGCGEPTVRISYNRWLNHFEYLFPHLKKQGLREVNVSVSS